MKKLSVSIATALLLLLCIPAPMKAGTATIPSLMTAIKPIDSTQVNTILARLNEIKGMDKSNMSAHEKKQLRKEVRSERNHLREVGNGVYLSVGGIIIVILLLIILL